MILLVSQANQTGPRIQAPVGISGVMMNEKFKTKLEKANSADNVYLFFSEQGSR